MNIVKIKRNMHRKFFFALVVLVLGYAPISFAQNTAGIQKEGASTTELNNSFDEDWTVYADNENNVFYIDFENLMITLNEVVVRNEKGAVVIRDEVFDLPVNTIYELDLSDYPSGNYHIELRAYTQVIRKMVSVR
jgi:hypothetical protein